jgi:hypothetical protein
MIIEKNPFNKKSSDTFLSNSIISDDYLVLG